MKTLYAGISKIWENHEKIPICSLRTLLTRFLDITSSPSRQFLTFLSNYCDDLNDKERMMILASESEVYEDWRHSKSPHLLEVLNEFKCRLPAALFVAHCMPLQPRFYSISSSQRKYSNEVHLTVAVVKWMFETNGKPRFGDIKIILIIFFKDGEEKTRYGVCSNYLESLSEGDEIQLFIRKAPSFRMPKNNAHSMILIGPGEFQFA